MPRVGSRRTPKSIALTRSCKGEAGKPPTAPVRWLAAARRESQLEALEHLANRLARLAGGGFEDPGEAEAWRLVESIVSLPAEPVAALGALPEPADPEGRRFNALAVQYYGSPAGQRFDEIASRAPVALTVFELRRVGHPVVARSGVRLLPSHRLAEGDVPWNVYVHLAPALHLVQQAFFEDEGWRRLKRCPQCSRWFVDRTKNIIRQRCSSRCTWGHWNYARRKASNHGTGHKPRVNGK